jgi:hypothetical protein
MKTTESLLAQWRDVNRRAVVAESALVDAALKYARGEGPEPTDDEMEEARALRAEAKVLFEDAIKRVDAASSSFGPMPE